MAITYAMKRCPNPNGIEGVDYFAPRVIKVDDYTTKELINDINDATGMSDVDVRAVLGALNKQIRKGLLNGRTVVLEDVGRISVGMKAKCASQDAMAAEDFSPSNLIKGVHINFRPDAGILAELRTNRSLRRISSEVME